MSGTSDTGYGVYGQSQGTTGYFTSTMGDVMFVTDAWAGVFKSTDDGATCFPTNGGITARVGPSGDGIPVFGLTFDPDNPDRLWIGTQYSRSVYCSDDRLGDSWEVPGLEQRAPTNPDSGARSVGLVAGCALCDPDQPLLRV